MTKKYTPIACGLYDELELRALRKRKVTLSYRDDNKIVKSIACVITDLFSKDKIEYLKTDGGILIRLDDLVEVDNITFNGHS
ncbi:MAG: hypothetical protein R6W68_01245 [Ignavibacteriaceae bacterium]